MFSSRNSIAAACWQKFNIEGTVPDHRAGEPRRASNVDAWRQKLPPSPTRSRCQRFAGQFSSEVVHQSSDMFYSAFSRLGGEMIPVQLSTRACSQHMQDSSAVRSALLGEGYRPFTTPRRLHSPCQEQGSQTSAPSEHPDIFWPLGAQRVRSPKRHEGLVRARNTASSILQEESPIEVPTESELPGQKQQELPPGWKFIKNLPAGPVKRESTPECQIREIKAQAIRMWDASVNPDRPAQVPLSDRARATVR